MVVLATDAIQWHEGMLLQPQHFQQNDLRLRELLHFHISQTSPFHWGVCHYKYDPAMLVSGTLHFQELEAIMPDGLVISSYLSEGEVIEIDLTTYAKEMESGPLIVYLAVPKYKHGAANATGNIPRFQSLEDIQVVDENTGGGELTIPRMAPNISLFVGEEPPSTYVNFPMFEVSIESNAYVVSDFITPCLKVKPASEIGTLCADLCHKIRQKTAFLSERLLTRSTGFMSAEAEDFARALSTSLLPFEAMLNSEASHPYTLYLGLCNLAGHVAGLNPAQIPPIFEPYNHNDLRATYSRVAEFINLMVDRIHEGYSIIPFSIEDRIFSLKLHDEWLGERMVLGAKAPPEMSISELTQWVKESVICTDSYVKTAMDNRVLGARRSIISMDEKMKLLPPKDVVLCEIEVDAKYITGGETLRVFNVSDTPAKRPIEVVLYIPKEQF